MERRSRLIPAFMPSKELDAWTLQARRFGECGDYAGGTPLWGVVRRREETEDTSPLRHAFHDGLESTAMDRLRVQLFGIAVILAGGFIMVGHAAGYPYDNIGIWGLAFGLGINVLALLTGLDTESSDRA